MFKINQNWKFRKWSTRFKGNQWEIKSGQSWRFRGLHETIIKINLENDQDSKEINENLRVVKVEDLEDCMKLFSKQKRRKQNNVQENLIKFTEDHNMIQTYIWGKIKLL